MFTLKRSIFSLALFLSVFAPAGAFALVNPTTDGTTGITLTDATLNGTNGDTAASQESFWVSLSGPINTSIPVMPLGVYSTPIFPGVAAGATFSAPLSLVTTSGIPSNLPAITPGTTYYYVAWTNVGGTWYSGATQSFTTLPLPPQTITPVSIPAKTYGDTDFDPLYTGGASGNPVTYTSTTASVCTVVANQIHIVAAGSCTFNADQAGGGSYSAAPQVPTTFNIAQKTITVSATAVDKVYDGNMTATFSGAPVFTGLVVGETLTLTPTFADRNVAILPKPITLTLGNDTGLASNYTLTDPMLTANITPRTLNYTATGVNKIYDGTTSATVTLTDDRVSAEDTFVTTVSSATFSDKNVGTAKVVTIITTNSDSGPGYGNYIHTFPVPNTTSANIDPLPVTVTGASDTKQYDNNTSSLVTPSFTALGTGDTASFIQTFDNEDVTGSPTKTMTPSGLVSDGNSGNNYTYTYTPANVGSITAKPVTITGPIVTPKVYDKTDTATVVYFPFSFGVGDILGSDVVNSINTAGATETYDNSNAGTGKTVTVTGVTLGGVDAFNYTLIQPILTGEITKRPITVRPSEVATKVYDGNTSSLGIPTVTLGNIIAPDTENFTQTYVTKVIGVSKNINASGIVNDDNGGLNYDVTFTGRSEAVITPRDLIVTATGINKTYDGDNSATVIYGDDRVPGDNLTITGLATFDDENVGTGKPVSVIGIAKSGADNANYTLTNTTTSTTADITPKTLTIVPTVPNKMYDTTTGATVTYTDDRLPGDVLGVTGLAVFSDKNVGPVKIVFLAPAMLLGADASNYTASGPASVNAAITAAPVTVAFTASNKVYDGNTTATITTRIVTGNIAPDAIITATGGVATFDNKNVGTGKTITALGFDLSDSNYVVTTVLDAFADVTPRDLIITTTGGDKIYDGNTSADVVYHDNRVDGDIITVTGSASFADKHVGTEKDVSVSEIAISGEDASNYTHNTVTNNIADITPRPITVTATTNTKVYNASTTALALPVISVGELASGDFATTSETYINTSVGAEKVLVPTIVIADDNIVPGANYFVTLENDLTGVITTSPTTDLVATVVRASDLDVGPNGTAVTNNSGKWFMYNDTTDVIDNTLGSFVTGPTGVPVGIGSVEFTLGETPLDRKAIATYKLSGISLSDIMGLSFSTNSHSGTESTNEDPYLNLNIDFTGSSGAWQRRLVYVPSVNGEVVQDAWQQWDAINEGSAKWSYSGAVWPTTTVGPHAEVEGQAGTTLRTWNQILNDYPNARLLPVGGWLGIKSGNPGPNNFTADIDNVIVTLFSTSTLSTTKTTYDFDPVAPVVPPSNGGGSGGGGIPFVQGTAFGGSLGSIGQVLGASTSTVESDTSSGSISRFQFLKNFRIRSRISPDVAELQKILIAKGFLKIKTPTGYFGPLTLAAVRNYQRAHNIIATGNVYILTRTALNIGL